VPAGTARLRITLSASHSAADVARLLETNRARRASTAQGGRMTGIADRPERFACFITGTDTGVGKTHATATLLHALHGAGYSTVGMKPIAAGGEWLDDQWQNDDVDQLRAAGSVIVPQEEMCPFFFARRYRRTWPPRSKARALRPSRFAMHSSRCVSAPRPWWSKAWAASSCRSTWAPRAGTRRTWP
jgi:hypothetical protein